MQRLGDIVNNSEEYLDKGRDLARKSFDWARGRYEDSWDSIKRNFYTSTLLAAASTAVSAPLEVYALGMNKYVSLLARTIMWRANYLSFPLTKAMRD